MTLLHIDTSILHEHSVSRQLTAAIVRRLTDATPELKVVRSDLVAEPIDHLSGAEFLAFRGLAPTSEDAKQAVARNAKALEDFLSADVIVIGAPMYNFSLPSQLKAWLDRIAVPGATFRYTENGVEGLANGKRVIIASSRGGRYTDPAPTSFLDHQETYLQDFFGFLGITDVTFVRAEGLAFSEESRTAAIEAAMVDIEQLAA
ncbi:FMN-dependent NADH-azoreductase [Burkholderia sp. Bp9142]|uniref:FMN-dependent NADH-azoreductase n=1 Tax=Burkholderia sp. Bp9142 TaxID=2184573 RepID=UPI000F5B706C|nr:NAD(P)H-dependent oxidoreductase [Burkholderia sp. Bp9142]RQR23747.1 FMN-dependent NADH-azoreductase [Burkholderia sp. Bp9142]